MHKIMPKDLLLLVALLLHSGAGQPVDQRLVQRGHRGLGLGLPGCPLRQESLRGEQNTDATQQVVLQDVPIKIANHILFKFASYSGRRRRK